MFCFHAYGLVSPKIEKKIITSYFHTTKENFKKYMY